MALVTCLAAKELPVAVIDQLTVATYELDTGSDCVLPV